MLGKQEMERRASRQLSKGSGRGAGANLGSPMCLFSRFVVVMGVDLSRCGPEHPASRCPWDSGLLLRFLAALAAVGALEPLLPGPLLAAHPQAGPSR